ncbi:hypothetical protein SEVIR_4G147501v4 [Setaria viridis]
MEMAERWLLAPKKASIWLREFYFSWRGRDGQPKSGYAAAADILPNQDNAFRSFIPCHCCWKRSLMPE